MSKLFYAADSIRQVGRIIPIVYEIPTYPLDTNETILYKLRDFLEMQLYGSLKNSIAITAVILRQDTPIPQNWISFHNGIDISNYSVTRIPELDNEVRFLIVANIADWHRYDRMIHAMHDYHGGYSLHLTVISPDNDIVKSLKQLALHLNIDTMVEFVGAKDISGIKELAGNCHIGIGQLSLSADCSPQINTLKTKDYCAMGLPFVTSCRDTSFESDFPYSYVLKDMDSTLDLEDIIHWYENIRKNPAYKQEMYDYAKEYLQFHNLVSQIMNKLNIYQT